MTEVKSFLRANTLTLVAIAAAVVLGLLWSHERSAAAEARRGQEAAELRAKDLTVAQAASSKTIADLLADSARQSADFSEALKRAQAAAPDSHVVTVITGSTGPVVAGTPSGASAPNPSEPTPAPNTCACLLRSGDRGQIDVASAELRTEAGNRVLVQAAEASRVESDGSRVRLFGGELRADLTQYLSSEVAPAVARPGWGGGPLAVCAGGGCSAGGVVALPPWHRLELTVGGFAGGAGPGGIAHLVWRP